MTVLELAKRYEKPLLPHSGTEYYAQSPKYKPLETAPSSLSPSTPLSPLSPPPSQLEQERVLDIEQFLQAGAIVPARNTNFLFSSPMDFLFTPTILPHDSIKFFATHSIPSDYHPHLESTKSPVHSELKKIVEYFEEFSRNCSLKEKIDIAEKIIMEIRYAGMIIYLQENSKGLKIEEKALLAEEMIDSEDTTTSPLFELGARHHLACSLFKMQSSLPQTKTRDIAAIFNFLTLKNTFVADWGSLRLTMHKNLFGRIGSNIADLLVLKPSLNDTLVQANELVDFYVNKLKEMINKGYIDSYVEEDLESTVEPIVDNGSINTLLQCAETSYRHALATQIVDSLSESYKGTYQKSGELPKDIADTIQKITAFLKLPSEKAYIRTALHSPCDPSKALLSSLFDRPKSFHALVDQAEQEANKEHDRTDFYSKFPLLFSIVPHAKINRVRANKIQAISWAEKQWNSPDPIPYSLPSSQSLSTFSTAPISSPDRIERLAIPHTSYLHLSFNTLKDKEIQTIWQSLSAGAKIDALRHINAWKFTIVKHPELFPIEHKILLWLQKTTGTDTHSVAGKKIASLETQLKIQGPLQRQGEALLDFYYNPHRSNGPFYPQLMQMIDAFAAKAPEKLFDYLSEQAEAAGWKDFNEQWKRGEAGFSRPNTFLHTIQATERFLRTEF